MGRLNLRIEKFNVSAMSREECVLALRSCKELEAKILKRMGSFDGEFITVIEPDQPVELLHSEDT